MSTLKSYVAIICMVVCSYALTFSLPASEGDEIIQQPSYGSAVVDGNPAEWDLNNDYFAPMYKAGKSNKEVLADSYLRYDCTTNILYVLVERATENPILAEDGDEVWVKIDGRKKVSSDDEGNSGSTTFSWINKNGSFADGWEASFPLDEGTYSIQIHNNVYDGESQTASTVKSGIDIFIECEDNVSVTLTSFTANRTKEGVLVEWKSASETGHAGYNLYKSSSDSGPWTKLNESLIGSPESGGQAIGGNYEYLDTDQNFGTYNYRLEALAIDGTSEFFGPIQAVMTSGVENKSMPEEFVLMQNYPNPFNPTTRIEYNLSHATEASITIINLHGAIVRTLVNEYQTAGQHAVVWDARNDQGEMLPSGTYLYQIKTSDFTKVKRMTFIK